MYDVSEVEETQPQVSCTVGKWKIKEVKSKKILDSPHQNLWEEQRERELGEGHALSQIEAMILTAYA